MSRLIFATFLGLAALCTRADNTMLDPAFGVSGRYNQPFVGAQYLKTLAHLPRPGGGSVAVVYYRLPSGGACVEYDCIGMYYFSDAGTPQAPVTVHAGMGFSSLGGAALDSQGRIVVVGAAVGADGSSDFRVVRLLANGLPDNSFSADGIVDIEFNLGGNNYDGANAVAIDGQDRIVAVGQVQRATALDTDYGTVRLLSNGTLDTSFDGDGKRATFFDLAANFRLDSASAVVIGSNGLITIGGLAYDGALNVSRIGLVRLTDGGAPDVTFCPTSCSFMGTYGAINNGRRVIFYGNDVPAVSDSIVAMAVNSAGEVITAGTTPGAGERLGYVQKFDTAGNWVGEVSTQGGYGGQVWIGGVHFTQPGSPDSNIVLTGASSPDQEIFFAQRFDAGLFPSMNWGVLGPSNSVYVWTGRADGALGDVGGNRPGRSSIDAAGRVLVGGSYRENQMSDPYRMTLSRLTYNGAVSTELLKNGFE